LSQKSTDNQVVEWELPKELKKELERVEIHMLAGENIGSTLPKIGRASCRERVYSGV